MSALTLFSIEQELLELMDFRESATTDEERAAADVALAEYISREIAKVDGIAAYIRECEARARIAKDEAVRLKARADRFQRWADDLKSAACHAMMSVAKMRLLGRHNELVIRKNPPAVDDAINMGLLPEFYVRRKEIVDPDKIKIREALKAGIPVPGARLKAESYRLEVK